jgi:hypothetical protein
MERALTAEGTAGHGGTFLDRDYQVAGFIDVELFPGRDDCRGAVFGDEGGAGVFLIGLEFFSLVNLRLLFLGFE